MFGQLWNTHIRPNSPTATAPRRQARRLSVDPLERRELLTADPGWSFGLGGPSIESETAVSVGPDNAVYITGSFAGTVDLDPGPGVASFTTNQNVEDGFVAKYTQQGQLLWANTFGGSVGTAGNELSRDVEFDASGNVYLVGISSASQPRFGSITLANQSPNDVFVAKVDGATGNFVWARRLGGAGNDLAYDAAVTPAGEVFVAGQFDGTVDFDPGAGTHLLTSAGDSDAFVWKLDAAGNFAWVRQFGSAANDTGQRLTLGNDGHVYAVGTFRESIDFGDPGDPLVLTNPSGSVSRISPTGSPSLCIAIR